MEKLITYLKQRGHQAKLSRELGISKAQVNSWYKLRRQVPLIYCARIEAATAGQVTRKDLCSDWQLHWPELAHPSSTRSMVGVGKRSAALLAPKKQRLCTPIEPAGSFVARTKMMRSEI